jgi:hypothetical protein
MNSVAFALALFTVICCFISIEAKKSTNEITFSHQVHQLVSRMFDSISQTDLRHEGRAISKRKMSWMKAEELMKMPLMKLHSIPGESWSGLTMKQGSKLSAYFVASLTQEQAKNITPRTVKSMPEGARRAYSRLINRPPIWFRLSSMAVAGGLAFFLYRYTNVPMKVKKQE